MNWKPSWKALQQQELGLVYQKGMNWKGAKNPFYIVGYINVSERNELKEEVVLPRGAVNVHRIRKEWIESLHPDSVKWTSSAVVLYQKGMNWKQRGVEVWDKY